MRAPTCYGYVYKTILPDGRFYIGQKKSDIVMESYYGSGVIIDKWFRKYIGEPSSNCPRELAEQHCVIREILGYRQDYFTLNAMEQAYIMDAKAYDQFGECLNIHVGGTYPDRYSSPEEIGAKISAALKGKKPSAHAVAKAQKTKKERWKPPSEETRKKMSDSMKKALENKPVWNKGLTKEVDERLIRQYDKNRPPVAEQTRSALSIVTRGTQWYNNGLFNVRRMECPDGFEPGMLPFKK